LHEFKRRAKRDVSAASGTLLPVIGHVPSPVAAPWVADCPEVDRIAESVEVAGIAMELPLGAVDPHDPERKGITLAPDLLLGSPTTSISGRRPEKVEETDGVQEELHGRSIH
jgi:hypothetical protein